MHPLGVGFIRPRNHPSFNGPPYVATSGKQMKQCLHRVVLDNSC